MVIGTHETWDAAIRHALACTPGTDCKITVRQDRHTGRWWIRRVRKEQA